MPQRQVLCILMAFLAIALAFSGCTSPQAAPVTPAATPAVTVPAIPDTTSEPTAAPAATPVAAVTAKPAETEKVILTTRGTISPTEFKTYDFKAMGDQFSQPGEKYRITLKADKPVIGYAVTSTQAAELRGNTMVPHYTSSSDKVQWGQITPYMMLEKVTDSSKTFTVDTVAPYVYVVDARWMESDTTFRSARPFGYELTIAKVTTAADPNAPAAHT